MLQVNEAFTFQQGTTAFREACLPKFPNTKCHVPVSSRAAEIKDRTKWRDIDRKRHLALRLMMKFDVNLNKNRSLSCLSIMGTKKKKTSTMYPLLNAISKYCNTLTINFCIRYIVSLCIVNQFSRIEANFLGHCTRWILHDICGVTISENHFILLIDRHRCCARSKKRSDH